MRWDELRLTDDGSAAPDGAVPLLPRGAVTRTFDTPEFAGMTFHEVTCRSALNKVPEASRMPFRWTINPYRGCTMACAYCLEGDTLILMSDGRSKRLSEVRKGDLIYGTERRGLSRRYVRTEVLDHWRTVKRASGQLAEFRATPGAWEFFETQQPSYRRTAVWWVVTDSAAGRRLAQLSRP
jgi:hypothetical protein